MMKAQVKALIILAVLSCSLSYDVQAAQAADKTLDKSNLTILGVVIGDCTSLDVYSKLGPSIPFKDVAKPDVTQMCYVSDQDETLVLFSFENSQCSRFRLMSPKNKFYKWHFCEKSPLVSKHLATASGLKLGIRKSRMKAVLGAPQKESDENLTYVYEWQQKMNKAEIERASQHSKAVKMNPFWTVKAAIRAEFSEKGLILFDVIKYSQY
jgi:hypothetical protein